MAAVLGDLSLVVERSGVEALEARDDLGVPGLERGVPICASVVGGADTGQRGTLPVTSGPDVIGVSAPDCLAVP